MEKYLAKLPRRTRRIVIAIVGGVVLVIGIIMIPYPGPGWLVTFMALAILSQEFTWAAHALELGKRKYDEWNSWVRRQHWSVKALTFTLTTLLVVATLWLLNTYGLFNTWFHLGQDWLNSPLPWFR